MKVFFSFLVCFGIAIVSCAQIVNYEIDSEFNADDYFTMGSVSDLLLYPNGKFLVTGSFMQTNNGALPTSRLFPNGQLDEAYGTGAIKFTFYLNQLLGYGGVLYRVDPNSPELGNSFRFEFKKPPYGGFISAAVNDVLVKDDSLLLVGGIFFTDSTDISPNSLRQLCMVDSTGAPIPDFPMVKCEPYNAIIGTINKLSTGEYIIGGRFSSVNEHATNNIAKLHTDFSVDTNFVSPLGDDGTALIQYIDSLNRMWVGVGGGGYIQDMPTVLPNLIRVLADGSIDSTFNIPQIMRVVNGMQQPTFSGPIIEDLDNTFIIGGIFTLYNGYEKQGLIKINDDGSLIPEAFANLGFDAATWDGYTSAYAGVKQIKKLPDGKLLIGGSFSSFGGEPYNCLIRLKPDGFVGIDEKPARNTLSIYPNPASESIRIRLPDKNQRLSRVEIYDLSGRLVKQVNNLSENKAIDVSDLTDGLYLVEGITGERTFCGKVVINQK